MSGLIPPKAYFNPSTPFYTQPDGAIFTGDVIFNTGANTSGVKITTIPDTNIPVSQTIIGPNDNTKVLFSQMVPVSQLTTLSGQFTLVMDQSNCGKINVLSNPTANPGGEPDIINLNGGSAVYPPGSFMYFMLSGDSASGSKFSFVYGATSPPTEIFNGIELPSSPGFDQLVVFWTRDGINWRRVKMNLT
jgi:hypothetical protein